MRNPDLKRNYMVAFKAIIKPHELLYVYQYEPWAVASMYRDFIKNYGIMISYGHHISNPSLFDNEDEDAS